MRPADVFVRELSFEEGLRRAREIAQGEAFMKCQLANLLVASVTEDVSAATIARSGRAATSRTSRVIHVFNERGIASLDLDHRGGRRRKMMN